jgi:hypothetical protein
MGEEYFDLEVREGIFLYRRETLVNSKRTKKGWEVDEILVYYRP